MHHLSSLLPLLVITFFLLTPQILARQAPTSFCKCICFTNSTIISLNSPPPAPPKSPSFATANFLRSPDDNDDNNDNDGKSDDGQTPTGDSDSDNDSDSKKEDKHHREYTCNDCNRAFCLDYDLPICKGAKEEDVFTSCFQRDSVKDETVVFIFIFLTAGLLSWALVKPWVDRFRDSETVANYAPVGLRGGGGGSGGREAQGQNGRDVLPRTEYTDDGEDGGGIGHQRSRGAAHHRESIVRQGGLNS